MDHKTVMIIKKRSDGTLYKSEAYYKFTDQGIQLHWVFNGTKWFSFNDIGPLSKREVIKQVFGLSNIQEARKLVR